VVTAGELILIVNGIETRYRSGEWYHVPPGQTHAARFEHETTEIQFWFRPGPPPRSQAPRSETAGEETSG
jgi:quercetin dioxygenase-like cupin family protein